MLSKELKTNCQCLALQFNFCLVGQYFFAEHYFQCIQHRALNPDDQSLPDLEPVIAR